MKNLKVERSENPQAVDREQPRFSRQMQADEGETNLSQESYQIVVKNMQGKTFWDSGRVKDGRSAKLQFRQTSLTARISIRNTISKLNLCTA